MGTIHQESFIDLKQPRAVNFPFRLLQTGSVISADSMHYEIRDHGHLEFCLRLSSSEPFAADELDGEMYYHRFPHLFLKKPHICHRYDIHGERHAVFLIYPSDTVSLFESAGLRMDLPGVEFTLTPALDERIRAFQSLFPVSQQYGSAERFDLLAFEILETIFLQAHSTAVGEDAMSRRLREAASYLQLHFAEPSVLLDVPARFGFSRRSFFRHWHDLFQTTPARYVQDLRMQEARRLLSAHSLQIREISERLGFQTPSYFIQSFKRSQSGITPGDYRAFLRRAARP